MTIHALGYIEFKTHSVAISKDSRSLRIYCFKHTQDRCDLESFTDIELAAEYILNPFPSIVYELVFPRDQPNDSA
jgi:hypothetical protein